MSDSYQPIYDAVRSRISNGDIGHAVSEVARSAFDISWMIARAQDSIQNVENEHTRPSVLMRPRLFRDGNQWCAVYGENLMDGIAGFGDTPQAAMRAFDSEWFNCNLVKHRAAQLADQICDGVRDAIS